MSALKWQGISLNEEVLAFETTQATYALVTAGKKFIIRRCQPFQLPILDSEDFYTFL